MANWRLLTILGLELLQSLTSPIGGFGYGYGQFNAVSALVSSIALPNGASIANHYDSLARLDNTALLTSWGHVLDGYGYSYARPDLRTGITRNFGLTTNNVTAGYDNIGQLTSWTAEESGGAARLNEQLTFGYDAADNLHLRTNGALVQTFTVDAANELTGGSRTGTLTVTGATPVPASVTVNGAAAQTNGDFTFASTNNSLISGLNPFVIVASNSVIQVTNNLNVNLPGSISLGEDTSGNLTGDGTRVFVYDAENQLTNVYVTNLWKTEFGYDGFGRRRIERDYTWRGVWVRTNETHFIYDGMVVIQERDSNNVPQVTYTRGLDLSDSLQGAGGIGGLLSRTDTNGSTFYHADGGGNVTALMDGKQNIVARYLYDPFGRQLGQWGTLAAANKYRFSSKEIHANSGMYYYGFRFYEPNLQRWLNQDPIGEEGGINLYQSFDNDPLANIDLFGLDEHHYVIGPIRNDPNLSPEAATIFKNNTTGDVGTHDYSIPHPEYNQAVQELWDKWIKGKNKSKLTAGEANDFLKKVKKCRDPRIKDFLKKLEERAKQIKNAKEKFNSRMGKLRVAAAAATAIGAVSALDSMASNPNYIAALNAAREGDEAGVDDAIYDLANDLAIETGDERVLTQVYGIYYWTKKLK